MEMKYGLPSLSKVPVDRKLINAVQKKGSIGKQASAMSFSSLQFPRSLIPKTFSTSEIKRYPDAQLTNTSEVFTISIKSNYGNKFLVTCSSIWFLDKNKRKIQPIKIKCPQSTIQNPTINTTDYLADLTLLKTNISEMWKVDISQGQPHQIDIYFFFAEGTKPEFVRIWNGQNADDTSVHEIEIQNSSKEILFNGIVPKSYGIDAKLKYPEAQNAFERINSLALFYDFLYPNRDDEKKLTDKFGTLPLKPCKSMTIKILQNWGHQTMVGLNALEIYDEQKHEILPDSITEIDISDAPNFNDPMKLFKENKLADTMYSMFIMMLPNQQQQPKAAMFPTIVIHFKEPVFISSASIYNYNGGDPSVGVKYCSISLDSEIVWRGKIRRANKVHGMYLNSVTQMTLSCCSQEQIISNNNETLIN